MEALIGVLAGDGIGPEVTAEAVRVLKAVGARYGHRFEFRAALIGGAAIDATGSAFPPATRRLCAEAHAVLLGAVGGPKWSSPDSPVRPEQVAATVQTAVGLPTSGHTIPGIFG